MIRATLLHVLLPMAVAPRPRPRPRMPAARRRGGRPHSCTSHGPLARAGGRSRAYSGSTSKNGHRLRVHARRRGLPRAAQAKKRKEMVRRMQLRARRRLAHPYPVYQGEARRRHGGHADPVAAGAARFCVFLRAAGGGPPHAAPRAPGKGPVGLGQGRAAAVEAGHADDPSLRALPGHRALPDENGPRGYTVGRQWT